MTNIEFERRKNCVNAYNCEVIFTALIAAGIRTVIAEFDFHRNIDARAYIGAEGDGPIELPHEPVIIQYIGWKLDIEEESCMLKNAIETVCYDNLHWALIGTLNGGGTELLPCIGCAYGKIIFDAGDKTIKVNGNGCIPFIDALDEIITLDHIAQPAKQTLPL